MKTLLSYLLDEPVEGQRVEPHAVVDVPAVLVDRLPRKRRVNLQKERQIMYDVGTAVSVARIHKTLGPQLIHNSLSEST